MRLDRLRAEEQRLGDLGVRPAIDDESGDLFLTLCESGDAGRVALAGLRTSMDSAAEQPQLVVRCVAVATRATGMERASGPLELGDSALSLAGLRERAAGECV